MKFWPIPNTNCSISHMPVGIASSCVHCFILSDFLLTVLYSGPEAIKLFPCSTQLSIKIVLAINLKLLTIAIFFLLNIAEYDIFSANQYENDNYCCHFHIY